MSIVERFEDILGPTGAVVGRRLVVEREAEPSPVTPRMTHFGFLSRLTPQERTAVRQATAADPMLDDAMVLFNQAREIDVTLPNT